jgi:hypothetical protein
MNRVILKGMRRRGRGRLVAGTSLTTLMMMVGAVRLCLGNW